MDHLRDHAKRIELVIFDVDGVLTDGSLFIGDDGQEYKAFNSKDGHGIRMLHDAGIQSAILTGRKSNVVTVRAKELGIKFVMQGHRDKRPAFQDLLKQTEIAPESIAYVGDDVIDLPVMMQVGLPIAVNDAHAWVKEHAAWTTDAKGGRGAAREVCEFILDAKGLLENKLKSYL
ncbi:MAG TPA: 3-deoxy-manno-octulosonate-8-phosphatase KdsC [Gammaproteobacteria bacterium]|jgi:3-deoxy-D-manno-octulosonate 8-phosphate phosphatase (KDO 8-P phosphatase)|nr:3-deoxy-manno-octulosonate-8-phosphatase KdsC [Gammaproteobacteria bacterium]